MTQPTTPVHKPRPMIDLLVSLILPSVILMKFSGEADLGADRALILALAFPFCWGAFELIKYRKFNFIALLGLISILLTGGIGLLQLDSGWLAVKEAAIPGLIGLVVLGSTQTRYPLIRTLLLNNAVLNADLINTRLEESGNTRLFEERLLRATYWLSSTFFFSSAMNYVLAKWIVVSPAGSEAFNADEPAQLSDDRHSFDDHADGHFLLPVAQHQQPHRPQAGRCLARSGQGQAGLR